MSAAAHAAFAELLSRRDGVSVGGPDVGNGHKKQQTSSLKSLHLQGPPGAALRRSSEEKNKKSIAGGVAALPAASASAHKIQAAWRRHQRRARENDSWAGRQKRAAEEKGRQQKREAWKRQEAEAEQLRKAYLAEEARLAREAQLRAEAERLAAEAAEAAAAEALERAAAEQAALERAAREAQERAERERKAAAEAAAAATAAERLLAAEREIARISAQRTEAVARVRQATERRARAVVRRAVCEHQRHARAKADAASGRIGRAHLRARARRTLGRLRAEEASQAVLKVRAASKIRLALLRWRRKRRDAAERRAAAATRIAAAERRRACERKWRVQRQAAARIAAAWGWHALRAQAARSIGAAARAALGRRRSHAASRRLAAAWRARQRRVRAREARMRELRLRALSQEARARESAASTRIANCYRRLMARRWREQARLRSAAEAEARRVKFERDNTAAACLGRRWAARQQRRKLVRQRRCAVAIQAHVRGFIERERCTLLAGGKVAFDFPRRLEECVLPFSVASTKLNAKAKADLAFVITTLKTQKTLKLRVNTITGFQPRVSSCLLFLPCLDPWRLLSA